MYYLLWRGRLQTREWVESPQFAPVLSSQRWFSVTWQTCKGYLRLVNSASKQPSLLCVTLISAKWRQRFRKWKSITSFLVWYYSWAASLYHALTVFLQDRPFRQVRQSDCTTIYNILADRSKQHHVVSRGFQQACHYLDGMVITFMVFSSMQLMLLAVIF